MGALNMTIALIMVPLPVNIANARTTAETREPRRKKGITITVRMIALT